jgi:hypothetical protein
MNCSKQNHFKDAIIEKMELGITAGDLDILIVNDIMELVRPDMTLKKMMEDYEINQNSILIAKVNPIVACLEDPLVIMGTY